MSPRPIGYVMEQTLGNVTHYLNLRRADTEDPRDPHRWIPIEYRDSRLPWTLPASWATRRALTPILSELDGIFLHTMTMAFGSPDLFAKKPTIISSDATPMAKRNMRGAYGLKEQHKLAEVAKRELFRAIFRPAAGFVGWSSWAAQSFVSDYGCPANHVAVIPPGVDLEQFRAGDRDHALPRVLFVGGDFVRKGGDLLLEVFREQLRGRAELVLVTGDAAVAEEPGVSVRRNVRANSEELRQLYASSDVFVLPTRADCFSLVCMEALAASIPVITTRVGGIPDIVLEGKTGHLIEVDDKAALTRALLPLIMEPARRAEMGKAARADAEERFEAGKNARRLFEFVRSRC